MNFFSDILDVPEILAFLFFSFPGSLYPFLYSGQCLFCLLFASEGCKPHVSLATRSEAYAWRTYHMGSVEQVLEELP